MIQDRLREVRFEEPRLVLDLDAIVDRAAAQRRRRSILTTTTLVLLTAAVMVVIGSMRDNQPPPAIPPAATPPPAPEPTCLRGYLGLWPKVLSTHLPKARLEPVRALATCPTYRLLGTGELVTVGVLRAGTTMRARPVLDRKAPGGGRIEVYRGAGRQLVRWVRPDGTTVQATATGGLDQDVLIAIVTDPMLRR